MTRLRRDALRCGHGCTPLLTNGEFSRVTLTVTAVLRCTFGWRLIYSNLLRFLVWLNAVTKYMGFHYCAISVLFWQLSMASDSKTQDPYRDSVCSGSRWYNFRPSDPIVTFYQIFGFYSDSHTRTDPGEWDVRISNQKGSQGRLQFLDRMYSANCKCKIFCIHGGLYYSHFVR